MDKAIERYYITRMAVLRGSRRRALIAIALATALAAVLSFSQAFSAAHAAKYGDGPHKHHGVACVIYVLSHHSDKAVAAAAIAILFFAQSWRTLQPPQLVAVPRRTIRSTRSRAPPSIH